MPWRSPDRELLRRRTDGRTLRATAAAVDGSDREFSPSALISRHTLGRRLFLAGRYRRRYRVSSVLDQVYRVDLLLFLNVLLVRAEEDAN